MRVRLSEASLAGDLVGFLRRAECSAEPADEGADVAAHTPGVALDVDLPRAFDEVQARMELALYLKVWQATHPGATAQLL